jgi:ABC-2 type transport system ATP-binding protein
MEATFQRYVVDVAAEGRTVLLSSHILAEVEALCHQVTIIRTDRTVNTSTLAELRHLTRTEMEVETTGDPSGLADLEGVHQVDVDGTHVKLQVDTACVDQVVQALAPLGVRSLISHPPTLEELFLRHYGGDHPAER